jgi:hypothetical protein
MPLNGGMTMPTNPTPLEALETAAYDLIYKVVDDSAMLWTSDMEAAAVAKIVADAQTYAHAALVEARDHLNAKRVSIKPGRGEPAHDVVHWAEVLAELTPKAPDHE